MLVFGALAGLLAGGTSHDARANPIAVEQNPSIQLGSGGAAVVFSYLQMDGAGSPGEGLIVQLENGAGWQTVSGTWADTGTDQTTEGGSGLSSYSVIRREDACPGGGPRHYRIAFDGMTPDPWIDATVTCAGAGQDGGQPPVLDAAGVADARHDDAPPADAPPADAPAGGVDAGSSAKGGSGCSVGGAGAPIAVLIPGLLALGLATCWLGRRRRGA